jgi:hypothetical protein
MADQQQPEPSAIRGGQQAERPPIRGGLLETRHGGVLSIEYRCCGRVIHEVPTHILMALLGKGARDGHVDHVRCPVCKDGWDITVVPRIGNDLLEGE